MADNTKEAAKVEQIDDQAQNENNNTEEENQEPVAFNIHVVSPKQEKIPLQVSVASVCVNPDGSTKIIILSIRNY